KVLPDAISSEVASRFRSRADHMAEETLRWRAVFEAELRERAAGVPVRASSKRTVWERGTVWVSSYSTQGWGAEKYARCAAEGAADIARARDLEAEVVFVSGEQSSVSRFEVVVAAESADFAILDYSSAPPLREQVRLSWK